METQIASNTISATHTEHADPLTHEHCVNSSNSLIPVQVYPQLRRVQWYS